MEVTSSTSEGNTVDNSGFGCCGLNARANFKAVRVMAEALCCVVEQKVEEMLAIFGVAEHHDAQTLRQFCDMATHLGMCQ